MRPASFLRLIMLLPGFAVAALPVRAETVSSHTPPTDKDSTTIRSDQQGRRAKVVRPPPPPPEPLIVIPVNPQQPRPSEPRR